MKIESIFTLAFLIMLFAMPVPGQQIASEWNNKGVALYNQSSYDDAISAYNKAIKLNPLLSAA